MALLDVKGRAMDERRYVAFVDFASDDSNTVIRLGFFFKHITDNSWHFKVNTERDFIRKNKLSVFDEEVFPLYLDKSRQELRPGAPLILVKQKNGKPYLRGKNNEIIEDNKSELLPFPDAQTLDRIVKRAIIIIQNADIRRSTHFSIPILPDIYQEALT